jgi:hypothetical protein
MLDFASRPTFNVATCTFGFLLLSLFFKERIASLGWTLFDLMTSDISRFCAISSLKQSQNAENDRLQLLGEPTSLKTLRALSAHPGESLKQTSRPS